MRRSPGSCGGRGRRSGGAATRGVVVAALSGGLAALTAGGLAAQVGGQPPERKVEERVRVPDLTPAQEAGRHEVHRGDTLWDLARRYLSDPLAWPRIFELNRDVVEDPHWIYPGEVLRLPGTRTADARRGEARPAERGERETGEGTTQETRAEPGVSRFGGPSVFDQSPSSGNRLGTLGIEEYRPSPLVSSNDYHRAPFLAHRERLGPTGVTARKIEGNPLGLSLPAAVRRHHRVVLALDGLSVEPGQRLQAIRFARALGRHGHIVRPMAVLEVTELFGDSARVEVLDVFGDYRVGDLVMPLPPFEFGSERARRPADADLTARLIGYEMEQVVPGPGDMVFLDAGEAKGVRIGDEFLVLRPDEKRPASASYEDRLAIVRVVRVGAATATAIVVDLQDVGMEPGVAARLAFRATRE